MSRSARLTPVAQIALAVGAAGAAAFAYGSLIERKNYTLRTAEVPVLPAGAEPIRVLHLSDLHMAPWQRDKQEWVRELAELKPDLIVDTGDNLGHRDGLTGIRAAFSRFAGIPGVFVNGSNDYFGPSPKNPFKYFTGPSKHKRHAERLDIEALHAYFDELGWIDLDNRAASLEIKGTRFEFFGVDDPHRGFDRLELITAAIDEMRADDADDETWPDPHPHGGKKGGAKGGAKGAANGADEGAGEGTHSTLTVGVAHAPYQRVLNSFVNHGAQLMLAGHTHGGQVCVPGFGALVTNCDIPRRQVKGLSTWRHGLRSAYLNVSAGLGTSIYAPVRFACLPEASLLTLMPTH